MIEDMTKAAAEFNATMDMLVKTIPGAAPMVEKARHDMAQQLTATFKPFEDLAEGRITAEQFNAIMTERAAADRAERLEQYGPGPNYEVQCQACGEDHEWDGRYHLEPPPLYFVCEDITGEDCQADQDASEAL